MPTDVVTQGLPQTTCVRLTALLHDLAARSPARRALLAVQDLEGSMHWAGAIGDADDGGHALHVGTPFFIASIDKLLNAVLALKLVEQDRLNLDARLADCLPPALVRGLHVMDGVDHGAAITVRQLLGHTTGLADWLEDRPVGGSSLVEQVLQHGDRTISLEEALAHVRRRLRPHHRPHLSAMRRPRYSDTNYLLLTAVIEAVTGQSLHALHQHQLWQPLGLRQTWMAGHPPPCVKPAAVLCASGRPLHLPLLLQSMNAIFSTAGDLMAFGRALFLGQVFDHPQSLAAMQAPWRRFGLPLDRAALRAPSWPIEYGLGLMRFRLPRLFTLRHAMPAVLGHTGSTGCWLFHCPQQRLLLSGDMGEVTAGALPFRALPQLLQILAAGASRG